MEATGNYKIKLNLSNYLGAHIRQLDNENDEEEAYMCIPIKRNGFICGVNNKVTSYLSMRIPRIPLFNGWTHTVCVSVNQETLENARFMGYDFNIMGNARPDFKSISGTRPRNGYVRREENE